MSLSTIHTFDTAFFHDYADKVYEAVVWLSREIRAFFCDDLSGKIAAVFNKVLQTPGIRVNGCIFLLGFGASRQSGPVKFAGLPLMLLALYRTYREYIAL